MLCQGMVFAQKPTARSKRLVSLPGSAMGVVPETFTVTLVTRALCGHARNISEAFSLDCSEVQSPGDTKSW